MNDKDGDTFDEAVEERVINEEYKVNMKRKFCCCLFTLLNN
jgi:hypothetical protein